MRPFRAFFFAFFGPIRLLRKELKTTTKKIENKLEPNQKVIIFFGFLKVFDGLPKPSKKNVEIQTPKKRTENMLKHSEAKNTDFCDVF